MALKPFCWRDKPALIEKLFPVQKLSAESYKEQMSAAGKTLTSLGTYWKGRKPLVLNKACILASLLPATDNNITDLKIFELLMGMDNQSMTERLKAKLAKSKHGEISQILKQTFNQQVRNAKRVEELDTSCFNHIWKQVNQHLGTSASSIPELVEQMGIARFGRRPKLADTFAGSGQIPFEAARLGCDVFASDLNPIACILSWANFNIVGTDAAIKAKITQAQQQVVAQVQKEITKLGIETDNKGWQAKSYLYCLDTRCPESDWIVPMLPSFIISKSASKNKDSVCVKLVADAKHKKYKIEIITDVKAKDLEKYKQGTVQQGELVHAPDGITIYRSKISSIRGDYKARDGSKKNKLRPWDKTDFTPAKDDIFQERLYCIHWMKPKASGKQFDTEFRAVTNADLTREQQVIDYIASHLKNWQDTGLIPDMRIEHGDETTRLIRERGWHYWHQLFNPRQLLQFALLKKYIIKSSYNKYILPLFAKATEWNSKLSLWYEAGSQGTHVFYNQALNTLNNYGCRSFNFLKDVFITTTKHFFLQKNLHLQVANQPAQAITQQQDLYITDPPYGDAVKYEEITEFFIAWLRKNPPQEFANWVWDSRRRLAIKGEDDAFREAMIASYTAMTKHMVANGIQVLMFTHKSTNIWASIANILWASGLRVTASWYVVTETDSTLRQGANIKGTVILVLRKRVSMENRFRDALCDEIQDAVKAQIDSMIGLDKQVLSENAEGLYTDVDLQMAGYAAALSVLTAYSHIDKKDMAQLAKMPEITGKKSTVTELIEFAVRTAVHFLVPLGFEASEWQKLTATEHFYLKMLEMECAGTNKLDDYLNFAKAFDVKDAENLMGERKANKARLKLATEFKKTQMKTGDEFAGSLTRAILYAMYEINNKVEITDVLAHLAANYQRYIENNAMLVKVANYIYQKRKDLTATKSFPCDKDAEAAHILAEALANQRL